MDFLQFLSIAWSDLGLKNLLQARLENLECFSFAKNLSHRRVKDFKLFENEIIAYVLAMQTAKTSAFIELLTLADVHLVSSTWIILTASIEIKRVRENSDFHTVLLLFGLNT